MKKNKIIVAGIGPGSPEDITPAVLQAVQASDVIVGYKYYFRFIKDYVRPDALCIDSGMKAERQRAEEAFRYASRQDRLRHLLGRCRHLRYVTPDL